MKFTNVTMKEVAARAGVSIATVSHVINDTSFVTPEVRQRVQAAIKELHYVTNAVAKGLRSKITSTIGLVVPNTANPFYSAVAQGVEAATSQRKCGVFLCDSKRNLDGEINATNLLISQRVDGIIFVGAWIGDRLEHIQAIAEREVPIIFVDRNTHALPIDSVVGNNFNGGVLATQHLIQLGHRAIGCIAGGLVNTPNADRLAGYLHAIKTAQIPVNESLIVKANFQYEGGYDAMKQLIANPTIPSAVFAANDLMALGAIRATLDAGYRVPDDVSIVGFDNIVWSQYLNPPLTTIDHVMYNLGFRAATILLDRIADPSLPICQEVLDIKLIVRGSTVPFTPK